MRLARTIRDEKQDRGWGTGRPIPGRKSMVQKISSFVGTRGDGQKVGNKHKGLGGTYFEFRRREGGS